MTVLRLLSNVAIRLHGSGRRVARVGVIVLVLLSGVAFAQPTHEPAPVGEASAAEASHEGGWLDIVARLANFGILAGVLGYFLRTPLSTYLRERGEQVRHALVSAAQTRKAANEQLLDIEARLAALPGELERLRLHGAQEIAAEQARIDQAAATERERVLAQTRRELDLLVRVARRDLLAQAAELATGVATERLKQTMTDDDQRRLIDRYVERLPTDAAVGRAKGDR